MSSILKVSTQEDSCVVYTTTTCTYPSTVLAWLKSHLSIYIELNLLLPIPPELSNVDYWLGKPIVCLAHHFFPDAFNSQDIITKDLLSKALELFNDRFHISFVDNDIESFFKQIMERNALESEIRDLGVGSTVRLYQDSLTNSTRSPSPRTIEDLRPQSQILNWEDIEKLQQTNIYAVHHAVLESQLHIRNELDFIQAKLQKVDANTIHDLELRLNRLGTLIQNDDTLVEMHKRLVLCANDVRYWFSEAERVCLWAQERLHQLELPQIAYDVLDFKYTETQLDALNQQYQVLQKEVQGFDTTKLRAKLPAELMTFDRLIHVLKHHGYELQMLNLRLAWEQSYRNVMDWIRDTINEVDHFIQHKARWQPPVTGMFDTLIQFEQILFEQKHYTTAITCFRALEDTCHVELPTHIISRHCAMESSFNDLTQRITSARQIVVQYTFVSTLLSDADTLQAQGESLQEEMQTTDSPNIAELNERVAKFQESMVGLVVGVASRIPYESNEVIRVEITKRKAALLALGESLDQGIASLRRSIQTQKRIKQMQDEIKRLKAWTGERLKSIEKSGINPLAIGKCGLDYDDVRQLKKELDGQYAKLKGINLGNLKDNIQAVSSAQQVSALEKDFNMLEEQLKMLDNSIKLHGSKLDALGRRILWENQHTKATQWVSNTTFQLWDFIARKAQWRISAAVDEDRNSAKWELMVQEEWSSFLRMVQDSQLDSVDNALAELKSGFEQDASFNHLQRRQDVLQQDYDSLVDLISFAKQVIHQHTAISNFAAQVDSLQNHGEQLIVSVKSAIIHIMILENYSDIMEQVKQFGHDVIQLWIESGAHLPYPLCPANAYVSRPSTNDDNISSEISSAVYRMYARLQELVKKLSLLMLRLDLVMVYRIKIEQWSTDVREFIQIVSGCIAGIHDYEFDLHQNIVTLNGKVVSIQVCQQKQADLVQQLEQYKAEYYDLLNEQRIQLHDNCVADGCDTVDMTILETLWLELDEHWNETINKLQQFQQKLSFCSAKMDWRNIWKDHHDDLSQLQNDLQEWDNDKALWTSDSSELLSLVDRCDIFDKSLNNYMQQRRPELVASHKVLVSVFNINEDIEILDTCKLDTIDELCIRLNEAISCRLSEIHSIQNRYKLEESYFTEATKVEVWVADQVTLLDQHYSAENLQDGICRVRGLESTISGSSLLTDLDIIASKTIQQLEADDNIKEATKSKERILLNQHSLTESWKDLADTLSRRLKDLCLKLKHTEFLELSTTFEAQCKDLQNRVNTADLDKVTEESWQSDIEALKTDISESIKCKVDDSWKTDYDTLVNQFQELNIRVQARIEEAYTRRLFFESAATLDATIADIAGALKVRVEERFIIQGDLELDKKSLDTLNSGFSDVTAKFCQVQDAYKEHNALYESLLSSNISALNMRQQELQQHWEQLESEISLKKQQYVDPMNQWFQLHSTLNDIKENTFEVMGRLHQIDNCGDTSLTEDSESLNSLAQQATTCLDTAKVLSQIGDNMSFFKPKYDSLQNSIQEAKNLLAEKKAIIQQEIKFKFFQVSVKSVCDKVHDHIRDIRKSLDLCLETKAISQEEINDEIEQLKQHITRLSDKCADTLLDQLNEAQMNLNKAVQEHTLLNDFVKRVGEHSTKANNIKQWFNDSSQTMDEICDFETVIEQFQTISNDLENISTVDSIQESVKHIIDSKVIPTRVEINHQWNTFKILSKMHDLEALVGEATRYTKSTLSYDQHSEGSVSDDDDKTQVADEDKNSANSVEEKQETVYSVEESFVPRKSQIEDAEILLKRVESEVQPRIDEKMNELDIIMKESSPNLDEQVCQQYSDLEKSISAFKELYHSALEKQSAFGAYLNLTENIETLQNSLEEAIHQITSNITEPLSRADLHAVLIELDARFKYYERRITPALLEAHDKAEILPVKDHLDGIEKRWDWIKKQFKTCKIELSRTIDTSAEDQQTRFRKSSLPTRKVLREVSPTTSTASSSSFSSKSTTRNNVPSIIKSPLPNSYVPDPKNDLDVEISRIVNEIPYKVEVRMAPGGPGRYWFGKVNPKLCYCRILKSKMVMVRVGGGWTELTKFLKNHTLLEGEFVPRNPHKNNNARNMIPEEDDQAVSPTMKDGFIETHQAVIVDLPSKSRIAKRHNNK